MEDQGAKVNDPGRQVHPPEAGPKPKKLLDRAREVLRLKHYSIRTEAAYIGWMRRYILFHNKRHPKDMGPTEIEAFLSHLAIEANVSSSTQNQAFNALLFLYRNVLNISLEGETIDAVRAQKRRRIAVVLTKESETCPRSCSNPFFRMADHFGEDLVI